MRSRFLLGKATACYVEECERELAQTPATPNFQCIYERYEGMMLHYPSFGAYVWKDLNLLRKLKDVREDLIPKIAREPEKDFNDFHLFEEGGDLLLKGLYQYRQLNAIIQKKESNDPFLPEEKKLFRAAHKILSQAIQKNVTCACYLALKVFFKISKTFEPINFLENHFYQIGIETIGKNKDYRSLEESFLRYPKLSERLYKMGLSYPPVLAFYALQNLLTYPEKDQLYSEAISRYGKYVPACILVDAAYIKVKIGNFIEAESLYSQALNIEGYKPTRRVLFNVGFLKDGMKKVKEAISFFEQALDTPEEYTPPAKVFTHFANLYLQLEEYEKAENCYEKALVIPNYKPSMRVLSLRAYVKFKLGKLDEAEALFDKILHKKGCILSVETVIHAAFVKLELKKFSQADSLFKIIFNTEGYVPTGEVLAKAALVNLNLINYEKAESFYDQAFNDSNFKPSPKTLNDAATVKFYLNKYQEAESLYHLAYCHSEAYILT